ncbi:MAG: ATP-dependent zinc metalloprotease FtsH [Candidatus Parcubacteria bacterium]|nr:MAG: ATP-dependent zinc metalloprotease FtsH [Candidatus Parcubacteria bacterium]
MNYKNIYIVISLLLLFLLIFIGANETYKNQKISLVEFIKKVQNNEITRIILRDESQIIGESKDQIYITNKDPKESVYQIFKDYGLNTTTIFALDIEQKTTNFKEIIFAVLFNIVPLLIIAWIFWQIFKQAQRGTSQIFTFSKSGIKVYNPNSPDKVTFKDVAGLEEAKEELMEIVEFLKNPQKFFRIGAKIPKGVLLVGPPGSGKTLLARAVSSEANVPFFYISGSEFVEMFVGVGAGRVRDAFSIAKKNQPCILFIDELDAIGKVRSVGITGGHEEREQTLNQILVEMDGFEKGTKIVILGATNRPDVLDPALLRPGRFDRKIVLDLPDVKAREEILKIHLRDKKIGKTNIKEVAERTPGFSGADLANLCNEAAILAARRNKDSISQKELLDSIEKVLLGPERKTKVYSKKEKEIAAYHESGHAIVAHYLPHSHPVQKISIVSRGKAGGYTLKLPVEEKSFYSKKEFLDELASILGGYAAEKLVFNDITTGASNDLEVATEMAKQMVVRFGMSENIGPISLASSTQSFIGKSFYEKEYSEKMAELIDNETKNILNNALERAIKILEIKKDKLEKLAKVLIKKEVIEKKQFQKLINEPKGSLLNV